MDDPYFTAILNRTGVPNRKTLASTILKTEKVNNDKTNVNNITFSFSSMERCRRENQSALFEHVMKEFVQLKPQFAALH